ncbi:MAG: sensor histidine kinase [Caulobacter sp.]
MIEALRRARGWSIRQARRGWISPLARLAGVAGVVVATMLLSAPLSDLARWRLQPSSTYWKAGPEMDQPERLVVGQKPPPAGNLPLTAPGLVTQLSYVLPYRPEAGDELIVLLPSVSGDRVRVFVNGVRLNRPVVVSARPAAAPWTRALVYEGSGETLVEGGNRVDLMIDAAQGRPLTAPIYIGPRQALEPFAADGRAWTGLGRRGLAILGFAAALAALMAALLSPRRRIVLLAASGLAAGLAARSSLAEQAVVEAQGMSFAGLDRLVASLCLLALIPLVRGRRRPPTWLRWPLAAMPVAWVMDILGPRIAPPLSEPGAWLVILIPAGLLAANAAATGAFAWRGSPVRRAEVVASGAVLALILLLASWSGLARHIGPSGLVIDAAYLAAGWITLAGVSLAALASLVLSVQRLLRTRASQAAIIRTQRAQIAAAASALEQEMKRAAILEERQRMARDMHDGVGGQLVSLIARLRSRRITIEQVEAELMRGLAELRLVVDSLDATGQSLNDAMLAFRLRAQGQVEGAGMTLDWSQPDLSDIVSQDPRWVLTLYRFMQEAVTNAVRHSGGRRLSVRLSRAGRRLSVEIIDDGAGFDADAPPAGKGLRNMAVRAGQLGGELAVTSSGRGSRIAFAAPLPDLAD